MTNPFDQLNLRPQERRVIVIVGLITFVVLNFLLVTPLFGQLGTAENQLEKSRRTLAKYEAEIAKASQLERIEERLKKEEGAEVLTEELQLQRIIDKQAQAANVQVSRYNPVMRTQIGRTNQFFEDQGLTIDFTTGGKELVEFLIGMASGNSMVHVQDMTLRPTMGGTRLGGNILFVASYQKKNPTPGPAVMSGSQPRSAKTTTPTAAAAPVKTNAPPKTNSTTKPTASKAATPAPKPASGAAQPPTGSRTISTNTAKSPKK